MNRRTTWRALSATKPFGAGAALTAEKAVTPLVTGSMT